MDRNSIPYEYLQRQTAEQGISPPGTVLYGIVLIYVVYQIFVYFDYAVLAPQELCWNAVVYLLPTPLLLDSARRQELEANGMLSQRHAAKSDALRRMLGMGGKAVLQKLPADGILRRASTSVFSRPKITSDAPPGLGNWDNSCYQNSVLQGLTSLDSLKPYLERTTASEGMESSTSGSLLETVAKLKGADNNGKQLWTPAKLKSMSSWQQQDAQEYFSKLMDELDKEAAKAVQHPVVKPGLEAAVEEKPAIERSLPVMDKVAATRNPMEGLLAQKVACTQCGFSEGMSMIPFNCLTVPLGSHFAYDLDECLDEYTKLEEITDVECTKCTLLRAERQLKAMLPQPQTCVETGGKKEGNSNALALPPELCAQAFKRLAAIQTALDEDDFEDKTVSEKCEIGKKARVSSTKTRQAIVARAPKSLVVHVNRSVFDEMTGVQRKNYASLRWPTELDLGTWMLRAGDRGRASGESLLDHEHKVVKAWYRIKAVVTHYGRHENGHYICYRRHPVHVRSPSVVSDSSDDGDGMQTAESKPEEHFKERWWRLSDEDVSSATEDEVLDQGGVFMLFYERVESDIAPVVEAKEERACHERPAVADAENERRAAVEPADDVTVEPAAEVESFPAAAPAPAAPAPAAPVPEVSGISVSSVDQTPLATTHADSETQGIETVEEPLSLPAQKPPTPPLMRTARGRQASKSARGVGGMDMRRMAAT